MASKHADSGRERVVTTGSKASARRDSVGIPGSTRGQQSESARAEALGWLEHYAPQDVDEAVWLEIKPLVTEAATRLATEHDVYLPVLSTYVLALVHLGLYCRRTKVKLKISTALDPYTVNQFAVALATDRPGTAATFQSRLRSVGQRLVPTAPWDRPSPVGKRTVAVPYTAAEVAMLRDQVAKNTPQRARGGHALMVLGLGAGLDGRWSNTVEKEHVVDLEGGLAIRVDGRVVPVLRAYEGELRALREETPAQGLIVGGVARGKNAANAMANRLLLDPACPRLNMARCRSTWLVTHLTLGTRMPELARAAGLVGVTTLSDLIEFVPALDEDPEQAAAAAVAMLRGPA